MKNDDDGDEDAVDDAPILCCAFSAARATIKLPFMFRELNDDALERSPPRSLLLLIKNLMKRINFLKISSHFAFACIKIMMTTTTAMMMMFQTTIKLKFFLLRRVEGNQTAKKITLNTPSLSG